MVEISENEIPKIVKSTSSPQLKENPKGNPAPAAKEQKTKPAVKEIFIVKKPEPLRPGTATRSTKETTTVATTPKPEVTKPQPAKTRSNSPPELRDKKSAKPDVKKCATKTGDIGKPQQHQQKKKLAGTPCGTCVKCKLPDCETCVFCQVFNFFKKRGSKATVPIVNIVIRYLSIHKFLKIFLLQILFQKCFFPS